MSYEKPRRSAGLVVAAVIVGAASLPLQRYSAATHDQTAASFAWIAFAIGVVLLVAGLWRFLDGFDAAALDRWHGLRAEEEERLRRAEAQRNADAVEE